MCAWQICRPALFTAHFTVGIAIGCVPEFLVAYDYGMGGLWAIVPAESAGQITARYPEVVIVARSPDWMDAARLDKLHRDPLRVDLAVDQGMLAAVVAERSK